MPSCWLAGFAARWCAAATLAGLADMARRTMEEHRALRRDLGAALAGDVDGLGRFASLLEAHVRFEERELFPACEASLPDDVLAAIAARAPKPDA